MSEPDTLIAFATAGTALITSLANGIVLVIKALRDKQVGQAVSNDLTTIGSQSPHVDPTQLETPKLIPSSNNHVNPAPAPVTDPPAAPAG